MVMSGASQQGQASLAEAAARQWAQRRQPQASGLASGEAQKEQDMAE